MPVALIWHNVRMPAMTVSSHGFQPQFLYKAAQHKDLYASPFQTHIQMQAVQEACLLYRSYVLPDVSAVPIAAINLVGAITCHILRQQLQARLSARLLQRPTYIVPDEIHEQK
jgi:hypothetical protein